MTRQTRGLFLLRKSRYYMRLPELPIENIVLHSSFVYLDKKVLNIISLTESCRSRMTVSSVVFVEARVEFNEDEVESDVVSAGPTTIIGCLQSRDRIGRDKNISAECRLIRMFFVQYEFSI